MPIHEEHFLLNHLTFICSVRLKDIPIKKTQTLKTLNYNNGGQFLSWRAHAQHSLMITLLKHTWFN